MKKKYLIFGILIILLVCISYILFPKNNKFYLDDIHYNTEKRFIIIESVELEKLLDEKKSFVVFTYLPYCTFSIPCDVIFETFLNENNMSFYSVPYDELSKVKFFDEVKYAPSVILVNKGKIVSYLDANSDDDLNMYQDKDAFKKWIEKYIYLKK